MKKVLYPAALVGLVFAVPSAFAGDGSTFRQNGLVNVQAVVLRPGEANRNVTITQGGYANAAAVVAIGGNGKYTITQAGQQNNTVSALLGSKQTLNINQSFSPAGWASLAGMGRR
ncbi:hypothetical protein [Aminobacter sp. J44]|uniref:hypothetical protein n=1 Tax=Aminobacter sp. J44 TaxID=935262 RepID=UPI00119C86A2|nr:hypothetical protein [Aminobacter sp. J44]TWG49139.1 hypothetical protein L610_000900000040 [Aminobacter sp. J44]